MSIALKRLFLAAASAVLAASAPAQAGFEDIVDLHEQQAAEKAELEKMKEEMADIKSTIGDSMQALSAISNQQRQQAREFHLFAREADWEVVPGVVARSLTFNGQVPGPVVRLHEGELVRIVLHNELKVPTSLYFHGMTLPHSLNGLPRQGAGLVNPGEAYAYQFRAGQPGTFWYHPQVIHGEQAVRGMYGAIVVEPRSVPKSYERDIVLVLGQSFVSKAALPAVPQPDRGARAGKPAPAAARHILEAICPQSGPADGTTSYFLVNGKSAPAVPAIELKRGERIRLRVINAAQQACPLFLSGHRFEVYGFNGSDSLEPHVHRDTITLQPGDRADLEFTADNPGVWSLASQLFVQNTTAGRFPGGIACVVRYAEAQAGQK